MKTLLLALLLLTSSECQIAVKIPFPASEYSKKRFNDLSYYNVDNWTKSQTEKQLFFQTVSRFEGRGEYELLYAWCTNLNQFVLVAYHNNKWGFYRYNPIFVK